MKPIGKLVCGGVILLGLLTVVMLRGIASHAQPNISQKPVLVNTCLITGRFAEMVDFYQQALGISPEPLIKDTYAEFHTGAGVLAIFSAEAQEKYIPGSAEAASNKSSILEFRVANVDAEYARLNNLVKTWVKPPTNQPWGTRSFYFRDPDSNLVDFYAQVRAL